MSSEEIRTNISLSEAARLNLAEGLNKLDEVVEGLRFNTLAHIEATAARGLIRYGLGLSMMIFMLLGVSRGQTATITQYNVPETTCFEKASHKPAPCEDKPKVEWSISETACFDYKTNKPVTCKPTPPPGYHTPGTTWLNGAVITGDHNTIQDVKTTGVVTIKGDHNIYGSGDSTQSTLLDPRQDLFLSFHPGNSKGWGTVIYNVDTPGYSCFVVPRTDDASSDWDLICETIPVTSDSDTKVQYTPTLQWDNESIAELSDEDVALLKKDYDAANKATKDLHDYMGLELLQELEDNFEMTVSVVICDRDKIAKKHGFTGYDQTLEWRGRFLLVNVPPAEEKK